MKTLSRRVISIFLCLNLLVNSFLPLVVYAQDFDPGGGSSYEEDSSDDGSYDYADSADPAETAPAEEPQEDASGFTPSGITPEFVDDSTPSDDTSSFTPPSGINPEFVDDSTPSEPTPAPISSDEVITDSTSQDRAFAEYASRAEAMDQYQDEVYANSRSDESGSGEITYLPSQITGMVQSQIDRVEERISEIAESTIPKTREEVLRDRRLEYKEEQLNKITEQADKEYEQAEKQRKEALQAAMALNPEQRIAALNASIGLPEDTPPERTLAVFNNAAESLGVKVEVKEDGSYTVSLDQPDEATSLTYTPYVPGSSFAPASISASSTIDPKPLCDHIEDSAEKDKCQNEWKAIAVGGTVAVAAAGAAIVSAPVWLPATSAGLSTAATIINTGTTAMYVYPTVAGGVLLSRSPAIVQQGIGVLAQASSVVIPAAVWASCQTQTEIDPVTCVSRDLGMADLPMVLAEGTKAVKAAVKVQGGADVAAEEAMRLARGTTKASLEAGDLVGEALYVPLPNQPKNVTVSSITDDMRYDGYQVAGITVGAETLAQTYPDQLFDVFSTRGSSAVIFQDVNNPAVVYKVYREGTEWDFEYAAKEAANIRRLSERGLAPKLHEYKGVGESAVPILAMDKIDFDPDGYRVLSAAKAEREIKRITSNLKELGLGPGDVEFVVDKRTGHLISVDSGGFGKLDTDGTAYGHSVEELMRDEVEGSVFGTVFDKFYSEANPVVAATEGLSELSRLGYSGERVNKSLYRNYGAAVRHREIPMPHPFDKDQEGNLLHLGTSVALGTSREHIQQIADSLKGKFSQEAIDKAIEAGRQAKTAVYSAIKGVSTQVSQSLVDTPYDPTKIIKADDFEMQEKKRLIKNKLLEKGTIDSKEVIAILQTDLLTAQAKRLQDGSYLLKTNKQGISEGDIEKDKYLIDVGVVPGYDIKTPSYVDLSFGDVILDIAVKEGTGKVEKIGYVQGKGQTNSQPKVKVVVLADDGEKVLPWAGVSVKLTKVNEENTISLNAGWNLISLTLLPNQALTASALLKEIADQDGNATAVSTLADGAWKSYVKRDGNNYSVEDFPIEVGKSYFIKALKPSTFKFSGQNLVSPVKLNLKPGWNTIGLPKISKVYKASSLLDTLTQQASSSGTLSWWDSGLWDTFVRQKQEEYGNNFTIFPSSGYIIKVEKEGEVVP